MANFKWIHGVDTLSPAAFTVRAQAMDLNDLDTFLWDAFFPRVSVDSVILRDLFTADFRPVATNRPWDGQGREIPMKGATLRELQMAPVEAYIRIGELELTRYQEMTGSRAKALDALGASMPKRIEHLVSAVYRRIEINAFQAWLNGNVYGSDTHGNVTTLSLGFAGARYATAGTAWDDAGVNAYNLLITWLRTVAIPKCGPIRAVALRQATLDAIIADAPHPLGIQATVAPTLKETEIRVGETIGIANFSFVTVEHSYDIFDDAGTDVTRTDVWPAQHVTVIPQQLPGSTYFAPVARAQDMVDDEPDSGIDVRGVSIFYEVENEGKSLKVIAQANAMTVPGEQQVAVIDAGV